MKEAKGGLGHPGKGDPYSEKNGLKGLHPHPLN